MQHKFLTFIIGTIFIDLVSGQFDNKYGLPIANAQANAQAEGARAQSAAAANNMQKISPGQYPNRNVGPSAAARTQAGSTNAESVAAANKFRNFPPDRPSPAFSNQNNGLGALSHPQENGENSLPDRLGQSMPQKRFPSPNNPVNPAKSFPQPFSQSNKNKPINAPVLPQRQPFQQNQNNFPVRQNMQNGNQPSGPPYPSSRPGYSPNVPGFPPNSPSYPSNRPGFPPGGPGFPPNKPSFPPSRPGFPPNKPGFQPNRPGFPPNRSSFRPNRAGFPPGGPGFPPGRPGLPPGRPGFSPGRPGFPPGRPGFPPGGHGFPPGRPGFLPGRPGFPPGGPGYPPRRPEYPGRLKGKPFNSERPYDKPINLRPQNMIANSLPYSMPGNPVSPLDENTKQENNNIQPSTDFPFSKTNDHSKDGLPSDFIADMLKELKKNFTNEPTIQGLPKQRRRRPYGRRRLPYKHQKRPLLPSFVPTPITPETAITDELTTETHTSTEIASVDVEVMTPIFKEDTSISEAPADGNIIKISTTEESGSSNEVDVSEPDKPGDADNEENTTAYKTSASTAEDVAITATSLETSETEDTTEVSTAKSTVPPPKVSGKKKEQNTSEPENEDISQIHNSMTEAVASLEDFVSTLGTLVRNKITKLADEKAGSLPKTTANASSYSDTSESETVQTDKQPTNITPAPIETTIASITISDSSDNTEIKGLSNEPTTVTLITKSQEGNALKESSESEITHATEKTTVVVTADTSVNQITESDKSSITVTPSTIQGTTQEIRRFEIKPGDSEFMPEFTNSPSKDETVSVTQSDSLPKTTCYCTDGVSFVTTESLINIKEATTPLFTVENVSTKYTEVSNIADTTPSYTETNVDKLTSVAVTKEMENNVITPSTAFLTTEDLNPTAAPSPPEEFVLTTASPRNGDFVETSAFASAESSAKASGESIDQTKDKSSENEKGTQSTSVVFSGISYETAEPPPGVECRKNERYYKCCPNCRHMCFNYDNYDVDCPNICMPGCFCNPGLVVNEKGDCVKPSDCKKYTCEENEEWWECMPKYHSTCANFAETEAKEDFECESGCFCMDGLIQAPDGSCVEPYECPNEVCKDNELATDCVNECNTCEAICHSCDMKDCDAGCDCRDGYKRDANGTCIHHNDCPVCTTPPPSTIHTTPVPPKVETTPALLNVVTTPTPPKVETSTISSQAETAATVSKVETTSVPPKIKTTTPSLEVETTPVNRKVETTPIPPKVETTQILPEVESSSILPEVEPSSILPEVEPSSILPKVEPSSILPEVEPSSILPEVEPSSILPEVKSSSILPELESSSILPELESSSIFPELESSPVPNTR